MSDSPVARASGIDDPSSPSTFARAFAEAVAERGVSLEALRRRLAERATPVSAATLSFWRSGRRQPEGTTSLAVVGELEDLLDLPPGHLTDRLGPSRRPRPVGPTVSFADLSARGHRIEAALHDLGFDERNDHLDQFTHRTLVFRGRERLLVRVRTLTQALRDGVTSRPVVSAIREGSADRGSITVLGGCRSGRDVRLAEDGLAISELVYDRPLQQGDLAIVEYETDFPYDALSGDWYELQLTRRVGEVVIWARFDPAHPPTEVVRYVEDSTSRTEQVDVGDRALSVIHTARAVGPGRVGISWSFDDTSGDTTPPRGARSRGPAGPDTAGDAPAA